jgi:hypothetical protein
MHEECNAARTAEFVSLAVDHLHRRILLGLLTEHIHANPDSKIMPRIKHAWRRDMSKVLADAEKHNELLFNIEKKLYPGDTTRDRFEKELDKLYALFEKEVRK